MRRYGDPDRITYIVNRWWRRRAIAYSVMGLFAGAFWTCVCVWQELGSGLLGWFITPVCFLPALIAGALLAQHLDWRDGAAWLIGAPSIIAMLLITGFMEFLFTYSEAWGLRDAVSMAAALILLGGAILVPYLVALRLARRTGNG